MKNIFLCNLFLSIWMTFSNLQHAFAFQTSVSKLQLRSTALYETYESFESPNTSTTTLQVENILKEQYPIFHKLIMSKNPQVWKELSEAGALGFTVFAVNDEAMRNLGEKRLGQLDDIRNEEAAQKMAAFHAVNEPVSAEELFNSGGVVTIGGVVDVGRSVSGGFLGIGGKEDGGTTVNGAKLLYTIQVDQAVIHEMDDLISPELLWRFVDQLRIPGSK
ncbi:hypothetical protein CTEN210_00668 [Chaetoceros tenuissimus]|uniref:FAS1 domain-containing protein n=1 Tax=Chaetoceros tenuissimus TaxID=426638 RepID=A0AAD3GZC6_9STRA|nr:hypothetical protein CTEN210_00668 [Chaetoceros tenuissimus]